VGIMLLIFPKAIALPVSKELASGEKAIRPTKVRVQNSTKSELFAKIVFVHN